MQTYKVVKISILLSIHIIWCILLFIYQILVVKTSNNALTSYCLNILFTNAEGIKKGSCVNYRGVKIGVVKSTTLYSNYVIVSTTIQSSKILIPLNAYAKTYKTIFMADTTLHIQSHNVQPFKLSKSRFKEQFNIFNKNVSQNIDYCNHNDFIYGFQGTNLDSLIDILIRLSIQLDTTDIIDLMYDSIENLNQITRIIKQKVLQSI